MLNGLAQRAINRFAAFQSFITLFVAVLASLITVSVSAQTNPQPSFLTNGLVAYYPFNGNANDESGNGKNGQLNGVQFANDRYGSGTSSAAFDASKYIGLPEISPTLGQPKASFTVSLWVKPTQKLANFFISATTDNSYQFCRVESLADNRIKIYHRGSGQNNEPAGNVQLKPNEWNSVIYKTDGVNGLGSVFINGTRDAGLDFNYDSSVNYYQPNRTWSIGTTLNTTCGGCNPYYQGGIDDVRIYNRALSDTEVKALYDYESKPPDNNFITNGLVAYYPFNGNAEDASGNGNAGLQVNTLPIADRFNKKSSAFAFNGTSSKVTIKNKIIDMGLDGYAINFWFSPYSLNQKLNKTSENGGGVLFNNISGLGIAVSFTTYTAPQYAQYGIDDGISGAWDMNMNLNYYGAKNDYAINKWYMATLVKNGGEYTFFINSDIQDRQSNSKSYSLKDGFIIGSSFWNEYFEGAIDDVRIYNRALSSNEVAQLYAYESQPQSAWIVVQISPTFQNPVWTSVATNTVPSSGPRQFYQMRASVVESAVDLKNPIWTPVATNNLPSEPQKFYRLVAQ